MRLRVLAVGKLKDRGLQSACDEYVKRSRSLLPLEVSECRDLAAARKLLDRADGPVVLLDERGEQLDTEELAARLRRWRDGGTRSITFAIGDAHGFTDADRAAADAVLALSRLTLPHRIARLVLLEQLYRAATILAGHPYHHGS